MIMQVHDELVLEVPESELELVKVKLPELMAGVAALKVPLLAEVGIGKNWDEAHLDNSSGCKKCKQSVLKVH